MAEVTVEIKTDKGLVKILNRMANPDFTKVMTVFGKQLEKSVRKTFDEGGFPQKWQPSKKTSGRTLKKHGNLIRVNSSAGKDYVIVGSKEKYAKTHQEGMKIKAKAGKALAIPVSRKAQSWERGAGEFMDQFESTAVVPSKDKKQLLLIENYKTEKTKKEKMRVHYVLTKSVEIPQRPFLPRNESEIRATDKQWLNDRIFKYIEKGV